MSKTTLTPRRASGDPDVEFISAVCRQISYSTVTRQMKNRANDDRANRRITTEALISPLEVIYSSAIHLVRAAYSGYGSSCRLMTASVNLPPADNSIFAESARRATGAEKYVQLTPSQESIRRLAAWPCEICVFKRLVASLTRYSPV